MSGALLSGSKPSSSTALRPIALGADPPPWEAAAAAAAAVAEMVVVAVLVEADEHLLLYLKFTITVREALQVTLILTMILMTITVATEMTTIWRKMSKTI